MNRSQQRNPYLLLYTWLSCLLLTSSVWAQTFTEPQEVQRGFDSEPLWVEEFTSNQHQWPEYDEAQIYSRVIHGKFRLASRNFHPLCIEKDLGLEGLDQFELSMEWRVAPNKENGLTGLSFGGKQGPYAISLTRDGKVQLLKIEENQVSVLKEDYAPLSWDPKDYNRLKLRQTPISWEFFLNNSYIFSYPRQKGIGSHAGIFTLGKTAIEVRRIQLDKLLLPRTHRPKTEIQLFSPRIKDGSTHVTPYDFQHIKGQVRHAHPDTRVSINGEEVYVNEGGFFSLTQELRKTENHVHIQVQSPWEEASSFSFDIIREIPNSDPVFPDPVSVPGKRGENYLLVIGIDRYQEWPVLQNAVKDVSDFTRTLVDHYNFKGRNVIQVKNSEATREKILETFEQLQETLSLQDNLLIYYAGHGYYDQESQLGYWVPVDARMKKIPDYIRNSTIHDYLRTIDTRHTFLIADACYAGSLFTNYRGGGFLDARSRWAFTSGDIEKVWDGEPGGNSPFAESLIRFLENYPEQDLPMNLLIEEVSKSVMFRTSQNPKGSPLRMAGDKGGVLTIQKIR